MNPSEIQKKDQQENGTEHQKTSNNSLCGNIKFQVLPEYAAVSEEGEVTVYWQGFRLRFHQ